MAEAITGKGGRATERKMAQELKTEVKISSDQKEIRRRCLIIYTGGTMGMHSGPDGVKRPHKGYLEKAVASLPEIRSPEVPLYDLLEWDEIMDSSDFSPASWIKLAKDIEDNYYRYDGFVVIHGTDTMAYTASALSFMLENLGKPVVLTGSMIPLETSISDAKRNLIISMMVAVNMDIPEVCIYFNTSLLRGNRSKKVNPNNSDAFNSPNMQPLAEMGVKVLIRRFLIRRAPTRRFHAHTTLFGNIAVMWMIPGFDDSCIKAYVNFATNRQVALVLQLYGAGNAPVHKQEFIETMKYAIGEKKCVVVVTSQCLHGSVDMSQYETGNILLQMGVIDGKDMTVEATVTKLAYLMGKGLKGERLKLAMEEDLRGELTVTKGSSDSYQDHSSDSLETPLLISKL